MRRDPVIDQRDPVIGLAPTPMESSPVPNNHLAQRGVQSDRRCARILCWRSFFYFMAPLVGAGCNKEAAVICGVILEVKPHVDQTAVAPALDECWGFLNGKLSPHRPVQGILVPGSRSPVVHHKVVARQGTVRVLSTINFC